MKRKSNKKTSKAAAPCSKCGRTDHQRSKCILKKGALVSVLYEEKWWNAQILLVHRGGANGGTRGKGGYKVKYEDDEGCEQNNVPAVNIRPRGE